MRQRFLSDPAPEDALRYKRLAFVIDSTGQYVTVKAWRGKQSKPYSYLSFRSVGGAEDWVQRERDGEDAEEIFRATRATEKAERVAAMRAEIQPGTFLNGSWGYDQTNQEFWVCVERRGAHAMIQRCGATSRATGFMSEELKPDTSTTHGEILRKLVGPYGCNINGSCTVSPSDPGRSYYASSYA